MYKSYKFPWMQRFCHEKRASCDALNSGGRWWIRTTEVVDNRFTVCPLWPLGKPPIFDFSIVLTTVHNYISKNRIWQEFFYVFYYNFSYFPVISPFRHTQNSTGA